MDPLTGLDPVRLWETARPAAIGLARYGPELVRAGALKLRDRIRHDPAPAQAAAEGHARGYTAAFGAVLEGLRARGQLTEYQLARAVASPAIARVLERAVLTARDRRLRSPEDRAPAARNSRCSRQDDRGRSRR